MPDNTLCPDAQAIVARQGSDAVILAGGEPTELYYHLNTCLECAELEQPPTCGIIVSMTVKERHRA